MQEEDLQALCTAVATLEHPGLAARLAEIAGKPIELIGRALPETASKAVATATTKALDAALSVALRTMKNEPKVASSLLHKALAATSGAVGGSFGLAALPIELPISTIIMLRSIGDVARSAWLAKFLAISPAEGAQTIIYLASSPEVANVTGKYFHFHRRAANSANQWHRLRRQLLRDNNAEAGCATALMI